jgi:sugar lactone lactonase YvrE
LACIAGLAVSGAMPLVAQTAHLAGGALISIGTGFNSPQGVAMDSSGNVFVTDSNHSRVKEIQAPSYSTTVSLATPSGAFVSPSGIAIDTAGNLFVTDQGNGTVKEIAAATGYTTASTVANGFSIPVGVAVDRDGNLFVADIGSNQLYELLVATSYSVRITIPVFFTNLSGVAVDANGNLFAADQNDGIQEIPASGGYRMLVNLASGNQNIVQPFGIALDSAGNLYYTDLALGGVFEIFQSSGYQTVVPVAANLNEPTAVAVDANGDVFIAEANNNTVDEIPAVSSVVSFGSVPIGISTPPTQTLTFEFDSAGKVEAPLALTQGAPGQDFKVSGGTCAAAAYAAGDTCTVTLSFTPKFAGLRLGALELVNSSGVPFVTIYVSGTGTGPQVAFIPGAQSTLGSGFSTPQGVATDGAGNVFVADTGNNAVKEILASGSYSVVRTLGGDFSGPQGVAVDGVGNVYVADTGNDAVKELSAQDGYSISTTVMSGVTAPAGVSVDGAGNVTVVASNTQTSVNGSLYVADSANNRVLKRDQTTPPTLSFAPAIAGSTSTDSPQTVTVSNIGNADLNMLTVSYATDFPEAAVGTDCASSSVLSAGASCTLSIGFSPLAASLTGASTTLIETVSLTDNNLNSTSTMQDVAVSGTAASPTPALISPAPGSTIGSTSATFTWAPGSATTFQFRLGTVLGSNNIYGSGQTTRTSELVPYLPTTGKIHAVLYYKVSGVWQHNDYTYYTPTGVISPVPGSKLSSSTVTFTWNPGSATTFQFRLGTTRGSNNLYGSGQTTKTSVTVNNLPTDGSPIHALLYYKVNGAWQYVDYVYTAQ